MAVLHDPDVRASFRRRLQALRPDSQRNWGKMSADQMLWHLNQSFRMALGQQVFERMQEAPNLPKPLLRWLVLNVPWPRGRAPTYKEMRVAEGAKHDFAAERSQLLQFIDLLGSKKLDGSWPVNPTLGPMTGKQWSQLQAKHVDHHLRQFGV